MACSSVVYRSSYSSASLSPSSHILYHTYMHAWTSQWSGRYLALELSLIRAPADLGHRRRVDRRSVTEFPQGIRSSPVPGAALTKHPLRSPRTLLILGTSRNHFWNKCSIGTPSAITWLEPIPTQPNRADPSYNSRQILDDVSPDRPRALRSRPCTTL